MPRKFVSLALAAALALGAASLAPARAQVNPFNDQLSDLSAEDLEKLSRAALALYDNPDTSVGAVDQWENTISGNSGAVRLVRKFEQDGRPCRTIQYRVNLASDPSPQFYELTHCKTEDGEWKIE